MMRTGNLIDDVELPEWFIPSDVVVVIGVTGYGVWIRDASYPPRTVFVPGQGYLGYWESRLEARQTAERIAQNFDVPFTGTI